MHRWRRYGPSMVVLATAVVILIAAPILVQRLSFERSQAQVRLARSDLASRSFLQELNDAVGRVARAVEPSVVHITVDRGVNTFLATASFEQSKGSGWVYDDHGHIITNHHVIEDASRIEVRFIDGSFHRAEVVGSDEKTDIAVIRIETSRVIPAKRANGHPVSQGDLVFAFGSPFGFEFSMSSGVVSGERRQAGLSGGRYENFIQTDAAINPGNSGGPLTNIYGEVIGMNFAIAVDSRTTSATGQFINSGVGLAIPLEMIEFVADQLIAEGEVRSGGLGVRIEDVNAAYRDAMQYHGDGVLLTGIESPSPAESAGLREDDIIFSVNGQAVLNQRMLRTLVHGKPPGACVTLGTWRAGEEIELVVVLGEWDRETNQLIRGEPVIISAYYDELGLTAAVITPALVEWLGLERQTDGLYVQAVYGNGVAARSQIRAGRIITMINNIPADSLEVLNEAIEEALADDEGEARLVLSLVDRDGVSQVRDLRLGDR